MASPVFFPPSPKDELTRLYVGKSIRDVPTPAAIMDVAVARRNCDRMLAACKDLNLSWRAHIKTHKVDALPLLATRSGLQAYYRRPSSPSFKSASPLPSR